MSDGTFLNEEFYLRLRSGETELTNQEKISSHITGSLSITGLKVDYGCEKNCVKNIITELRKWEELGCQSSYTECGTSMYNAYGIGENVCHIDNEVIKQKTELIIGQDVSALFDLLDIETE